MMPSYHEVECSKEFKEWEAFYLFIFFFIGCSQHYIALDITYFIHWTEVGYEPPILPQMQIAESHRLHFHNFTHCPIGSCCNLLPFLSPSISPPHPTQRLSQAHLQ